jgi:rhodanese-related sulfurtransferase
MPRLVPTAALAALLLVGGCSASSGSGSVTPAAMGQMAMTTAPMSAGAPSARASSLLVDPEAFAAAVAAPGTVTIDVHIPFEGKIAGTDLMIPYNQVEQQAAALPANRATPLAIYCRSGNMSAIAAPTLASLGYTHIVELRGGMDAWKASGRTLLSSP